MYIDENKGYEQPYPPTLFYFHNYANISCG